MKQTGCPLRKSRKMALFSVLYVIGTIWFLATFSRRKMAASSVCKTNIQSKHPEGDLTLTRMVDTNIIVKEQTYISQSAIKIKGTSSYINGIRRFRSAKGSHVLIRNKQNGVLCDMDKYIKMNYGFCNDLINNLTKTEYANKHEQSQITSLKPAKGIDVTKEMILRRSEIDDTCDIILLAQNCYALRHSYMYGKYNIAEEEKSFPLAFAMKLHTNANQANRLLRYIYRPHNVYCVHIDRKAPTQIYDLFDSISKCLDNVLVIRDRIAVIYSTIRQVQAEMMCMRAMMKSDVRWKYYINLAGQEFMLKTNLKLVRILKDLNGSNNIESYPIGRDEDRILTQTVLTGKRSLRTSKIKQQFHRNITIKKGSAYGLFRREFVHFVTTDNLVAEFIEWLKDTYAPEETVWATLNALPGVPGGNQGDITNEAGTFVARAVKWGGSNVEKCHGKIVRHVCIYGIEDLPWLLDHGSVVANKFYEGFQPQTLDCLENHMYRSLKIRR